MTYLKSLTLNNFRSYGIMGLRDIEAQNIVLCGANGAGKTNILEALSLLSPGRGLRGAKVAEIQNQQNLTEAPWSVSSEIQTPHGTVRIGTGRDIKTDKRLVRINGENAKTQASLGEWLSCLWLTPQMDRLFMDDRSQRRRFFDRLIYTFDPSHMGRLTRYENAVRQRMKMLKDGQNDPVWHTGIESQIAETAISICAARTQFCEKLQHAYQSATQDEQDNFPSAHIQVIGDVETLLKTDSALESEEKLKTQLQKNRSQDAESGTTAIGAHRSDFTVTYTDKNMPAAHCSTGEQKALLIGIILAHARLLREERADAPLLLLDEIVAHLDQSRRGILSDILSTYGSQVWMTGTDPALFDSFQKQSCFYEVSDSSVSLAASFSSKP